MSVVERHCLSASLVYVLLAHFTCANLAARVIAVRLVDGKAAPEARLLLCNACQIVSGVDQSGRPDALSVASGVGCIAGKPSTESVSSPSAEAAGIECAMTECLSKQLVVEEIRVRRKSLVAWYGAILW